MCIKLVRTGSFISPQLLLVISSPVSSWSSFYPSFSNIIPSFHAISPHDARQDEPNAIHCTGSTDPQDYKQDQRLVIKLCNTRPPTETVHTLKVFHTCHGLLIPLPQDESSSEVSLLILAGRVDWGLRFLLSSRTNVSSTLSLRSISARIFHHFIQL